MNKKMVLSITLTLVSVFVISGCGNTNTTTIKKATESDTAKVKTIQKEDIKTVKEEDSTVCDENGNIYTSEQEAKKAGLSEAQYGATYCDYMKDENGEIKPMLNATYTIEESKVSLVDGKAEVASAPGSASKDTYTMAIGGGLASGDLNGDGKDDGAGVIIMNSAGSGTFYYAVAYVNNKGTNGIFIGDRVAIDDVVIKDGTITVTYLDRVKGAPMSDAPTVEKEMSFVVKNGVLVGKK
jgi:uncharacterized lipoprotein NlpE involved in copper resistance